MPPRFPLTITVNDHFGLDHPLGVVDYVAVPRESATIRKWNGLVETFKVVSGAMQKSDQPVVAVGGFAMFLHGNTSRDPADIDFWTTEKGSDELQQLLRVDKRFEVTGPGAIQYTSEEGDVTTFDLVVTSASTPTVVKKCVKVVDEHGVGVGMCATAEDLFAFKYVACTSTARGVEHRLKDCRDALFLMNKYGVEESKKAVLQQTIALLELKKPTITNYPAM